MADVLLGFPFIYNRSDDGAGFAGAEHKKFTSEKEARSYLGAAGSKSNALKMPTTTPYPKPTFDERQHMKRTQLTSVSESPEYRSKVLSVYTDGACSNNGNDGARAGSGVWYGPDDPR